MPNVIVPNEWTKENPFVYYSLYLWHNSDLYADQEYTFSSCSECISNLKNRLSTLNNHIAMATIREETIFKRTEHAEVSISSPLFHFDNKKGFTI